MNVKTKWTTADIKQLQFLVDGSEHSIADIAAKLQRTQGSVRSKMADLGLANGDPKKIAMQRKCMCCSKTFPSQHSMNRMCLRCRAQSTGPFDATRALLA